MMFYRGQAVQVEVSRFGKLGASVDIVGIGHDSNLIADDEVPLGTGLILQSEIKYFRQSRNGVDVLRGEVLPGFVEHVRVEKKQTEEDGEDDESTTTTKILIDVSLRPPGVAKLTGLAEQIMERLSLSQAAQSSSSNNNNNTNNYSSLNVGDKSSPEEIAREFPGASKTAFKKAVAGLYKEGKVKPEAYSITLMERE